MTSVASAPSEVAAAPPRRVRPVVGWALAGVVATALAAYCFAAWFASGQAESVGTGVDPVPGHVKVAVLVFQVSSGLSAVLAVAYVVRRCRRERQLCLDAMILIGWSLAWWHDPLLNWLRPVVFYNAQAVNLGSWADQVPGWFSPHGETFPEPLLVIGCVYVWMPLFCAILADTVMTRVRVRRPTWGPVGLFLAGWAAVFAYEVTMEVIAVRLELTAYPSSLPHLTLWAGQTYQMPVYEALLWSLALTAPGALRHFRRTDGSTAVEAGADRLGRTGWKLTAVRLFAVIGFINVVAVTYDVAMVATSLYPVQTEDYPSYLRTGQCGEGTGVVCPGPGVPLVPR